MTTERHTEYLMALKLAFRFHGGQTDKGGTEYVLHPLTVADKLCRIEDKIVAVMHDLIEDTEVSLSYLHALGFKKDIIAAIDAISKRSGNLPREAYDDYITRVMSNSIARRVKMADLTDNMDTSRLDVMSDVDHRRMQKYRRVYSELKGE